MLLTHQKHKIPWAYLFEKYLTVAIYDNVLYSYFMFNNFGYTDASFKYIL